MLKKNYWLVAVLSFMSISPAFSMENDDEGSNSIPIEMETPREKKASQNKDAGSQSPSPQQDAEEKTPEDLKKDSPPSTKPSKKRMGWCCLSGPEDDD